MRVPSEYLHVYEILNQLSDAAARLYFGAISSFLPQVYRLLLPAAGYCLPDAPARHFDLCRTSAATELATTLM